MNKLSARQSALGISLISMATLMLELLVNKVLSFSTWGSFGYMIIGSAIFGFSIAGVFIAVWQPHKKFQLHKILTVASLIFSLSVVACYLIMNFVPFNFNYIVVHPVKEIIFFAIWYLSLLLPFSMTGLIIALLLMSFKDVSNRLYAADLVGAGIGCLIVVPLFPLFGAAGQYFVCAAIGALCAFVFSYHHYPAIKKTFVFITVLFLLAAPFAQHLYPVKAHQAKRGRAKDFHSGNIQYSMWSFLSKIEVAIRPGKTRGMLWFDGGLMQSAIDRFDGDYEKAKKSRTANQATSIPYRLKPRKNVLIIAPGGGRELRAALVWGAKKVTGVELDSSVVKLVNNELNGYLGGIFNDNRVTIVNDEGRSFVRRSKKKYDSIQFISAYSTTAIQSGAVNLANSYLVTKNAFTDYFDHLTDDGVLAIARDLNLKLFFTAWEALEERGLNPEQRLILLNGATLGRNTLLAKLTPFGQSELDVIGEISQDNRIEINYAPSYLMQKVDSGERLVSEPKTRQLISQFIAVSLRDRDDFYRQFPFKVQPVVDDRPFFYSVQYVCRDIANNPARLTEEMKMYTKRKWYIPYLPIGYVARLVVLLEAAVLALLFLIFPLWKRKSEGITHSWQKISMFYFFALGLGFIWVEIILLKMFVLFLGSPVYSIAVVLFAMLTFAGIGSFYTEQLTGEISKKLIIVGLALLCLVPFVIYLYPVIFNQFLGVSFFMRVCLSISLIFPVGFILGMPFPIGLEFLGKANPESIPWAWAINGYATVIGVSTSGFAAMQIGFSNLLWVSLSIYLLGFLSLCAGNNDWKSVCDSKKEMPCSGISSL